MYLKTQIENLLRLAQEQESYEPYHETLEKITLTGAEYFDLGYKLSDFAIGDTIRFEGIIKGTEASSIPSSGSQLIFSLGNDGGQWLGKAQNGTKYAFGSSNQSTIDFNEEVLADVTITLSGNASKPTFTITGSVTSDTTTSTISQRTATPVYYNFPLLFGAGTKSTGEKAYGGDYTIKCGKVYINGTMTKNYVPALDSQMRPCLYDKISKTFTYAKKISDGTDATDTLTFKRWNKFDVDYISFTGTQRIATGIKPRVNIKTDITFRSDYTGMTASCLIGARYAASGTRKAYAVWQCVGGSNTNPQSGYMRADLGNSSTGSDSIGKSYLCVNWTNFVKDSADNYLNNEFKTANTSYDFDFEKTSVDINIGCMANGSVGTDEEPLTPTYNNYFIGDIGRCIMYVEDVLARDFKAVIWHNGDSTAEACLYDEVYNKMYQNAGTGSFKAYIEYIQIPYTLAMHDSMDITIGSGAYINANGVVTADSTSCYTKAIPVKEGDVITLTVTGRSSTVPYNKRIHGYTSDDGEIPAKSKGSWVQQLDFINFPAEQTEYTTQQISVTVPSGINYIRLSHCVSSSTLQFAMETQCDLTITRAYEVGTYIQTLKTSTVQTMGYMVDLGIEPKDGIGYHIKTSTNANSSNYVFGARKEISNPSQQSNKPIIVGLTGSQTGGTIMSSVTKASATWTSDGTNWVRPSSSTSSYVYECSMQTYKENNELKFNVIGYNYTLVKNADRQTVTYTDAIDNVDEANMSTLHIGGLNANNILNGNNAFYFIECRQPNTDMTLLPVVNNNQFYFIDNKTKQTYPFYKIGSPTPTTDNIRIKKLDGTFIDGTL